MRSSLCLIINPSRTVAASVHLHEANIVPNYYCNYNSDREKVIKQ